MQSQVQSAGALGVYDNAAWGGLVVLPVTSIATYFLCTVIGVAIYVALCAIFKKDYAEKEEVVEISIFHSNNIIIN